MTIDPIHKGEHTDSVLPSVKLGKRYPVLNIFPKLRITIRYWYSFNEIKRNENQKKILNPNIEESAGKRSLIYSITDNFIDGLTVYIRDLLLK